MDNSAASVPLMTSLLKPLTSPAADEDNGLPWTAGLPADVDEVRRVSGVF